MTLFHKPDADGNYTDEELAQHLISSDCSECVSAGMRFLVLVKKCQIYENGIQKITGKPPEND